MTDREVYDLINRWYILRKLKLLPPLWSDFYVEKRAFCAQEIWKFWTLEHGTYGDKVHMTVDDLRAMVVEGERNVRKPVGHADEVPDVRGDARFG